MPNTDEQRQRGRHNRRQQVNKAKPHKRHCDTHPEEGTVQRNTHDRPHPEQLAQGRPCSVSKKSQGLRLLALLGEVAMSQGAPASKAASATALPTTFGAAGAGMLSASTLSLKPPSALLEAAMSELLPSNDPLDQAGFDAVEYINKLFPDAASLGALDETMARLQASMAATEEEIVKQVRRQSLATAKGKRELQQAKLSVEDLFKQIAEIKEKAQRSERMVEEVTRDIRSLDYAKKNLTASITTLKRLNMLVTGVAQLRAMAGKRQYREVGALLQAVASLSVCFEDFQHVPKIAEAKKQFEALQEECSNLVYSEFEALDHHAPTPAYFADLCVVVEALGRSNRLQFMSWFVKDRLLDYEQQFREGEEVAKLDNIKTRFQWLRRELQFYTEHFEHTFPASWDMPQLLCEEFCLVTKERLGAVLQSMKAGGTLSVRTVIDTMKATIAFEKELNKRFGASGAGGGSGSGSRKSSVPVMAPRSTSPAMDQEVMLAEQKAKQNPFSPEALKLKWKKFQQDKAQQPASEEAAQPCTRFSRIVSDAFEPYLDIYVAFEEKEMANTMGRLSKQPDVFEDRNMVFESSQIMFDQFREVMDTCTSLSRGSAFLQISELFRSNLRIYSDYLIGKLPRLETGGAIKLKEGDEKTVCFVINTAEYCTSNVEALAETVKNHIDPTMAGKVEMAVEQDRFQTVVARGMQALVRALETRVVMSAFAKMQKQNWSGQDSVVVESEYVALVDQIVREGGAVSKWLSKSRFSFFCDSFANSFIPRLREAILSLRLVNEVGAEQLLLDVAHVKTTLDALPKQGGDRVPARYKRIVQKEIGRLERLVKVMLTPKDGAVIAESYLEMVPKGNAHELGRILELRGIAKPGPYLERYERDKDKAEKERPDKK